jgi:hypothetical protein
MSVEADAGTGPSRALGNVSGELPALLEAGPMFRRSLLGYDRFQVDTYVRWAEDELAAADHERDRLVTHHQQTRAELEQARQLLSHSPDGGEMLRLSERIGSMLAAAADEARSITSEARATRRSARANAKRMLDRAEARIAAARDSAARMLADAADEAAALRADAARTVAEAQQLRRDRLAEAAARLEVVRAIEARAVEETARIREQAVEDARAARVQARDEIVRMLDTGREQRRRADAEAAATRERLSREATRRTAGLRAEVAALERRRAWLQAEIDRLVQATAPVTGGRVQLHLPTVLGRFSWRPRSMRTP